MPEGPLSLYRARRGTGTLKADDAQAAAAEKLQSLHQALRNYRPQAISTPSCSRCTGGSTS
jgi:cell division protein ZapE